MDRFLDIDTVVIIIADKDEIAGGMVTANIDDIIAFLDKEISGEEFFDTLTITPMDE
jgi:hypothetical protein